MESACRPIAGTGERRAQACPLLHSMKGETMSIQAAQFAATFERLGRRMLAQLESFPEELWDRAPLIHHKDSLLTLATRLLDESDHWGLVVAGKIESRPDVRERATGETTNVGRAGVARNRRADDAACESGFAGINCSDARLRD